MTGQTPEITPEELEALRVALTPLINTQFDVLKLPRLILPGFEPGQIGSLAGLLMDACIPQLAEILPPDEAAKVRQVGLNRHAGDLGDREVYPDYIHQSGKRLELKALYVDPEDVEMKKPPTPREPSARLTQKVTLNNVNPTTDVLLVIAHQLRPDKHDPDLFSITIIDLGLFSMIECVRSRDQRLLNGGGMWFGNYLTPTVLSKTGKIKKKLGEALDTTTYGRKAEEGRDFNEDTNFGKLSRIPYPPLRAFLKLHGAKTQ